MQSRRSLGVLVLAGVTGCASLTLSHEPEAIESMPLHESKFWTFMIGEPQHGGLCYFAGARSYSLETRQPYLDELQRRGFDEFEVRAVAERSYYQGMRAEAFRCSRGYPFAVDRTADGQVWVYCDIEAIPEEEGQSDEFRCVEDSEQYFIFYDDERLWDWRLPTS